MLNKTLSLEMIAIENFNDPIFENSLSQVLKKLNNSGPYSDSLTIRATVDNISKIILYNRISFILTKSSYLSRIIVYCSYFLSMKVTKILEFDMDAVEHEEAVQMIRDNIEKFMNEYGLILEITGQ